MGQVVFFVAALAAIATALAVVVQRNPFVSALALVGNLASLATLYLLLEADFVAAAQVIVYAGAVMVMFLFVIAYIGRDADAPFLGGPSWQTIAAVGAAGAILVDVVVAIGLKAGGRLESEAQIEGLFGGPYEVGRVFLTDHLLAFEITSIVLLVAAVGGVILGSEARRRDPGKPDPGMR